MSVIAVDSLISSLRVVAVNSIGAPWSPALLEELAGFPPVLVLPGESLCGAPEMPYRPQSFKGLPATECFARLRSGWRPEFKAGIASHYDAAAHERAFVNGWSANHTLLEHAANFTVSYYEALKESCKGVSYHAFVCRNFVLHSSSYPDFAEKTTVLHLASRLPLWLAQMSQGRTWEGSRLIRYWLVNRLFLEWFKGRHPNVLMIDLEEFAQRPAEVRFNLERWFGCNYDRAQRRALRQLSTPRLDEGLLPRLEPQAQLLSQVYKDYAPFRAAQTLEEWAPSFLRQTENVRLLQRYQRYWNTTSHVHLDFLGPLEEELVERIVTFAGAFSEPNLSFKFYHEYFEVDADNPDHPSVRLKHSLGSLEEEIVFPLLPAYLRIAMAYLESLASHSPRSPRQSLFYQRLQAPAAQAAIAQFGLQPQLEVMEAVLASRDATPPQFAVG